MLTDERRARLRARRQCMLTDSERLRIDAVRALYETQVAASVEAMRIVQDTRGWVSDEGLADVAEYLDVSPSSLESLATFYSLIFRKPVGRHVIMVCDSVCCWMEGSEALVAHLSERLGVALGGTSDDGRFTLLPVVCLGACEQAPALLIDWQLHGNVDTDGLESILAIYP
jgi:NADH-quinone oxidoreductase subunit E